MVNYHVCCRSFEKAKLNLCCSIYFDQVMFFFQCKALAGCASGAL